MEKTNYPGHNQVYQKHRHVPEEYAGWLKHKEFQEDWNLSWKKLLQKKQFPSQGKMIEFGCGAGNVGIEFAKLGYEVIGIDIAPTAIEWANENAKKAQVDARFFQGNLLEIQEFPEAPFDIVLDGRCFHCIIGKDREQFLKIAHQLLKPGGVLVVNTMCNDVPQSIFERGYDPKTRYIMHKDIATRYIGESNDILKEVMCANFRIISAEVDTSGSSSNPEDIDDLQIIAKKIVSV